MTEASALGLLEGALKASLRSESPTELWVAVNRKKRSIGFALFVRGAGFLRSTYLRLIVVDSTQKRAGIGRALIARMEKEALKPHGILLLVTSKNHRARRFYEALGYRKVGLLRDYVRPGLHECLYFKPAESSRSMRPRITA
jgi:ribosomal protein S18 acetylase RimI-like enzyme